MRPMSFEDEGYEAARLSSSDPSSGSREHAGGVSAVSAGIAARTGYGLPGAERAGEGAAETLEQVVEIKHAGGVGKLAHMPKL